MNELEGVIKYQLRHRQISIPNFLSFAELTIWRHLFKQLDLIGQTPERYQGYGFGNISQRIDFNEKSFVISGTQTGHLATLQAQDYCIVTDANPLENWLESEGECQPSSEALTHASVYAHHPQIQAVIHVHSPTIWQHTLKLSLPYTSAEVAYGTPEMAAAVAKLLDGQQSQGVFSMLGHQDGVIAFGKSLAEAAHLLIEQWALAQLCAAKN
ncbi:MAG: hypothetical protein RL637_1867 [Pseudomonadota bacterium]|jgi:ribulose-5-phosphate 4-epimerase/fuculose-1-phosphate aldolase